MSGAGTLHLGEGIGAIHVGDDRQSLVCVHPRVSYALEFFEGDEFYCNHGFLIQLCLHVQGCAAARPDLTVVCALPDFRQFRLSCSHQFLCKLPVVRAIDIEALIAFGEKRHDDFTGNRVTGPDDARPCNFEAGIL